MKKLMIYFTNSVLVTILDVCLVYVLYRIGHVNLVVANTIGVVTGFFIDYLLSKKLVFTMNRGRRDFVIYFGTFLIGLVFADCLIYLGNQVLFVSFDPKMNFIMSKGLSVAGPFFLLYLLRFYFYDGGVKDEE
ncbi:predicted membrane protein [Lachnospiraceae bacterium KM106-2]|nr:predicted membrane protein [Lachnospiraceae bacterium KM106-2]